MNHRRDGEGDDGIHVTTRDRGGIGQKIGGQLAGDRQREQIETGIRQRIHHPQIGFEEIGVAMEIARKAERD